VLRARERARRWPTALFVFLAFGASTQKADAQPAPVPTIADSMVAPASAFDSTAAEPPLRSRRVGPRVRPWHAKPWAVMARSAIVPGWGQATNGKWIKAGLAVGLEAWTGARVADAWRDANDALDREAVALAAGDAATAAAARADYNAAYDRRATGAWLLGAAIVASMLDAYVDAHFLQFDADFGPDPRLPDDATGQRNVRFGVTWAFTGP
jgi:hypothetical protein